MQAQRCLLHCLNMQDSGGHRSACWACQTTKTMGQLVARPKPGWHDESWPLMFAPQVSTAQAGSERQPGLAGS